jgi:integrase
MGGVQPSAPPRPEIVASAARAAGIERRVTPHSLRHACATHMLKMAPTSATCKSCSGTPA